MPFPGHAMVSNMSSLFQDSDGVDPSSERLCEVVKKIETAKCIYTGYFCLSSYDSHIPTGCLAYRIIAFPEWFMILKHFSVFCKS